MAKTSTAPAPGNHVVPVEPQVRGLQPVKLNNALVVLARAIDETAASHTLAISQATGHTEKALLMAHAITALREAITAEVLAALMPLMNSPNGFKCDRPNKSQPAYTPDVVKECLITSLIRGLYPVNNEWNIIAGSCYTALNGAKRLFESIPGISDISVIPGTPQFDGNVARCRVAISWKRDGVPNKLTDPDGKNGPVFTVQLSGPSSPDAVIGKAKRKAYMAALDKATGSVCTAGDDVDLVEPGEVRPVLADRSQQVLAKLPEPAARVPVADDLETEDAARRAQEERE